MKGQNLVTICIPVFNNELTIVETLESIIAQTYKNLKIKIFDNASTDGTSQILFDYEGRFENIEVIKNPVNIGGEANFTKCILGGEGLYTAVFHADDVYLPTMVEEQVEFLDSNYNSSAVATHSYIIDDIGQIVGERFLPEELSKSASYNLEFNDLFNLTLKYSNIITCPSVMVRTEIYQEKIKKWNGEDFKTAADLDVWFRLSKIGKFGFIRRPLMKYRHSVHSFSYRTERLCTRFERQDIFLVLEHYLNERIGLSTFRSEKMMYDAMIYVDVLHVNINKYLSNRKGFERNVPLAIKFNKKFFYYVIINRVFEVVKFLPLPSAVKIWLKKVKGRV